jgi:hypothetical protein
MRYTMKTNTTWALLLAAGITLGASAFAAQPEHTEKSIREQFEPDKIRTHDIHVGDVMVYGLNRIETRRLNNAESALVAKLVAQSEIGTTVTKDTFCTESQSQTGTEVAALSTQPNSDDSTETISQRRTADPLASR